MTSQAMIWSATKKKSAAAADITSTLPVVAISSLRDGQVTLSSS